MWKSFQRTFFFLRKIPPSASKCFAAIEKVSTLLLQGQVNLLDGEERSCKNRAKFHNCFSFCLILALWSFVVCRRTFLFGGGTSSGHFVNKHFLIRCNNCTCTCTVCDSLRFKNRNMKEYADDLYLTNQKSWFTCRLWRFMLFNPLHFVLDVVLCHPLYITLRKS